MQELTKQVLYGSLMGDGSLSKPSPKHRRYNSFFGEQHSIKQADYLIWKAELLSEFSAKTRTMTRERWGKKREEIHLWTLQNPELTMERHRWYPNGIKVINEKILEEINEIGLAFWIQDDGANNKRGGMFICSDGFSEGEALILCNWLLKEWNLIAKPVLYRGRRSRLYLHKASQSPLFEIIKNWIHLSMFYKFDR